MLDSPKDESAVSFLFFSKDLVQCDAFHLRELQRRKCPATRETFRDQVEIMKADKLVLGKEREGRRGLEEK